MSKYEKLSRQYYINMSTEYLAYEMYLTNKYQRNYNYSIEIMWNTCLSLWVIEQRDKENIINANYRKKKD